MSTQKRSYELKERARRQARTRQRIVNAAVALHQQRGPAGTTIAEIARRARVSRLTVYSHFPEEGELFAACQAQFLTENPLPDLAAALAVEDPDQRIQTVLEALYRSYRRRAPMTSKVLRDRDALPALDALLAETLDAFQSNLTDALTAALRLTPPSRKQIRALIALTLDFRTWERLTREGLSDDMAAAVMANAVSCAVANERHAAPKSQIGAP